MNKQGVKKKKQKYQTEKKVVYTKVKKKRFRIKFHIVIIALLFLYLLGYIIYQILSMPITNIYIKGNSYHSDWDIIKIAKLDNYPSSLSNLSSTIEKRLENNLFIKSANVKKTYITRVYITVDENRSLFYDSVKNKTIFEDGRTSTDKYDNPVLLGEVPTKIYDNLIENLKEINDDVFSKISEIKYDPDKVDKNRFLLTMTDGNYVYLTKLKFSLLNDYNDMVKEFSNKKGILYLNSGGYFKILEN